MFIEAKTFGPVVVQQNEMRILWPIRICQPSISKAFEAVDQNERALHSRDTSRTSLKHAIPLCCL
jgi:hypothetical protein